VAESSRFYDVRERKFGASGLAVHRLQPLVNHPMFEAMTLDLSDEEAAALLRELDHIIDSDRYFLSSRIKTLRAIRAKIRPEPVREPLPPAPERYEPPRATSAQRRRRGR
jgi:hypothetical protein